MNWIDMGRYVAISVMAMLCLAVMSGCKANHLVYVNETDLGVVVTASATEGGEAKLVVGYDRQTFALVPRKKSDDSNKPTEAMSLTAVSRVYVKGLSEVRFGHAVATGKAASIVVTDGDRLAQTVEKVFKSPVVPGANQ